MSELSDILHLLICDLEHEAEITSITKRDENVCYYYVEEGISGGGEMPDHLHWEHISAKFIDNCEFADSKEALDFIRKILLLSQETRELCDQQEERISFALSIIGS